MCFKVMHTANKCNKVDQDDTCHRRGERYILGKTARVKKNVTSVTQKDT